MKRDRKMPFSGIQSKLFILSLIAILLLTAAFIAITSYQGKKIVQLANDSGEKQQTTISQTTGETMDQVVTQSLGRANGTEALFVDDLFSESKQCVTHLRECVKELFENPEKYSPHPYAGPDPNADGIWTAKVIYAEGTDVKDPAVTSKLGLLANISDTMISMCRSFEDDNFYIGLPEGAFYSASRHATSWFVDGKPRSYDPRERIWYQQAAEAKKLIFTDGEWDADTGRYCIECAAPVFDREGSLLAVVGMDLYLDEIQQVLNDFSIEGEYNLLVSSEGKAVLPMQAETFPMAVSDRDADLRESRNEMLSGAVADALKGKKNDVTLGRLEDGDYYVIASPIETTGWVLVSAYSQEVSNRLANELKDNISTVQDEAAEIYRAQMAQSQTTAVVMLAAAALLILGGSIILGRRIVKPLNTITRRISEMSGGDMAFQMEDAYRTGDEVQELAESFAALSQKTVDYMDRIVKVTAEKERIGAELALANQIQATMLPHLFPAFPERSEFDIYASMDPAKEVGGDFYDYFLIDDDHLGLVIADVSGKGIPAALFMMSSKIIISDNAMMGKTPAQVLCDTNSTLCANGQEDMFVTVWIGILELSTGKLTAANGGHEYPVLMKDGRFELYHDEHGLIVGGLPDIRYRDYEIQLKPGDKIFVYTDGIPEAHDADRKMFGIERMVDALNADPEAEPHDLLRNVRRSVDEFVNDAEQFDDLTMLCLEYRGKKEEKGDNAATGEKEYYQPHEVRPEESPDPEMILSNIHQ